MRCTTINGPTYTFDESFKLQQTRLECDLTLVEKGLGNPYKFISSYNSADPTFTVSELSLYDYTNIGPNACPLTCYYGDSCGTSQSLDLTNVCAIGTSCVPQTLTTSIIYAN